jgi:hypothetical protein
MMVTLGVCLRRWRRMLHKWIMDPKIHGLLQSGVYLLAGFFFSAASLAGWCQPIALGALCALSGWPALLVAAGGMGGYLAF